MKARILTRVVAQVAVGDGNGGLDDEVSPPFRKYLWIRGWKCYLFLCIEKYRYIHYIID